MLLLLALGVFSYFIFYTQFLLDNHAFRMPWLAENEQVQNGRWMGPVIGWLHYGANVPVVMPGLSLAAALASVFIIIRSYGSDFQRDSLFIFGAIIIVCPINLAFYYYGFMSPIFFIANLLACVAAALLTQFSIRRLVSASIVVVFMLATYQAAIGALAVLVVTGVIWRACESPGSKSDDAGSVLSQIVRVWSPALGAFVATTIGLMIYLWTIQYLPDNGKAIDLADFGALVERIREVSFAAFRHLIITQPDILNALNVGFGILVALAAFTSLVAARENAVGVISLVLAWPFAILASKAIFYISDPGNIYQYRYNSGLIYLYGFAGLLVSHHFRAGLARIAAVGLSAFVIVVSVQADLVRQHVLMRGQERDLSTFNRILYRIETLENFDPSVRYDLIRVGALPRYRLQLLRSRGRNWDELGDGHMDYGEISDIWVDDHVFGLLGSSVRLTYGRKQSAAEIVEEGLLDEREPWPSPSSVFIDGERIIVYVD
ncbi:glucosyltransferase domain-containing protein [uncultured Maricaulis sp.]|uniref:glucosyltransferase domain-containing protein n=1 Tax=uncultured Maricaulis sp. TaxID=174710 RepID=UPI0026134A59|nr:glucosyltransferase domain-containing protein [uncultured Maricaulis sp.]